MAVLAQKSIVAPARTKELRQVLPENYSNGHYILTNNALTAEGCCSISHIKHAIDADNGEKNITNKTQVKHDRVSFPRKPVLSALAQHIAQLKGAQNILSEIAFANTISPSNGGIYTGKNCKSKSLNVTTQEFYWFLRKILALTTYSQEARAAPTKLTIVFGAIEISMLLRTILLMKSLSEDVRRSLKDFKPCYTLAEHSPSSGARVILARWWGRNGSDRFFAFLSFSTFLLRLIELSTAHTS